MSTTTRVSAHQGLLLIYGVTCPNSDVDVWTNRYRTSSPSQSEVVYTFQAEIVPFCKQGRGRSRLCGYGASKSGRFGSRRCRGRSWHRQSPAVPCTVGTPWGLLSAQDCWTSYRTASLGKSLAGRPKGWCTVKASTFDLNAETWMTSKHYFIIVHKCSC